MIQIRIYRLAIDIFVNRKKSFKTIKNNVLKTISK